MSEYQIIEFFYKACNEWLNKENICNQKLDQVRTKWILRQTDLVEA